MKKFAFMFLTSLFLCDLWALAPQPMNLGLKESPEEVFWKKLANVVPSLHYGGFEKGTAIYTARVEEEDWQVQILNSQVITGRKHSKYPVLIVSPEYKKLCSYALPLSKHGNRPEYGATACLKELRDFLNHNIAIHNPQKPLAKTVETNSPNNNQKEPPRSSNGKPKQESQEPRATLEPMSLEEFKKQMRLLDQEQSILLDQHQKVSACQILHDVENAYLKYFQPNTVLEDPQVHEQLFDVLFSLQKVHWNPYWDLMLKYAQLQVYKMQSAYKANLQENRQILREVTRLITSIPSKDIVISIEDIHDYRQAFSQIDFEETQTGNYDPADGPQTIPHQSVHQMPTTPLPETDLRSLLEQHSTADMTPKQRQQLLHDLISLKNQIEGSLEEDLELQELHGNLLENMISRAQEVSITMYSLLLNHFEVHSKSHIRHFQAFTAQTSRLQAAKDYAPIEIADLQKALDELTALHDAISKVTAGSLDLQSVYDRYLSADDLSLLRLLALAAQIYIKCQIEDPLDQTPEEWQSLADQVQSLWQEAQETFRSALEKGHAEGFTPDQPVNTKKYIAILSCIFEDFDLNYPESYPVLFKRLPKLRQAFETMASSELSQIPIELRYALLTVVMSTQIAAILNDAVLELNNQDLNSSKLMNNLEELYLQLASQAYLYRLIFASRYLGTLEESPYQLSETLDRVWSTFDTFAREMLDSPKLMARQLHKMDVNQVESALHEIEHSQTYESYYEDKFFDFVRDILDSKKYAQYHNSLRRKIQEWIADLHIQKARVYSAPEEHRAKYLKKIENWEKKLTGFLEDSEKQDLSTTLQAFWRNGFEQMENIGLPQMFVYGHDEELYQLMHEQPKEGKSYQQIIKLHTLLKGQLIKKEDFLTKIQNQQRWLYPFVAYANQWQQSSAQKRIEAAENWRTFEEFPLESLGLTEQQSSWLESIAVHTLPEGSEFELPFKLRDNDKDVLIVPSSTGNSKNPIVFKYQLLSEAVLQQDEDARVWIKEQQLPIRTSRGLADLQVFLSMSLEELEQLYHAGQRHPFLTRTFFLKQTYPQLDLSSLGSPITRDLIKDSFKANYSYFLERAA